MNDHLISGPACHDLVGAFEPGPEGVPATTAYMCSAGVPTLWLGSTTWPDGTRVRMGDRCTPEQGPVLLAASLKTAEAAVKRLVTRPLKQHEFDALVSFVYNLGEGALAKSSTLLPMVNANRVEDAAEAFSAFIYATAGNHKRALRGLLRRRYAEGCVFLGYDWRTACDDDAIRMRVEKTPREGGGFIDRVREKTEWASVLAIAERTPLLTNDLGEVVLVDRVNEPERAPEIEDIAAGVPEPVIELPEFKIEEPPVQAPPVPPAPQPTPAPKPSVPAIYVPHGEVGVTVKDMARSRRFWGLFLIIVGRIGMAFGIPTGAVTALNDPVVSELMIPFLIMGGSYAVERVGDFIQDRGRKGATALLK